MKKLKNLLITLISIAVIPLIMLFGCGKRASEIPYSEQTVRAFGYSSTAKYPLTTICTSNPELKAYMESFNYIYSSDISGKTALAEAAAKYDENYFKTKALILVLLQEPSGSISHNVNMILKSGKTITIEIARKVPEMHTGDMALWQMIFEVDQSAVNVGDTVNVDLTN